ncbi:patatin-like phospholipase family protein [Lunatibacter salilacus]|uniref:patatin-like phospholipase family protein n=1 Tax=Lunatibacter salilacus TaxID=2483804 RepID=UPI00131D8D24|nr:patatin-like phospholipase family protein [Lunatibacter salilacus]
MNKALVISGGGSKGAFAVGAIEKLLDELPIGNYDIVVGTSTGALIAPLAIAGKYNLLRILYTTVRTEDIIVKDNIGNRLGKDSIFEAGPLWNLLKKYYTDDLIIEILEGAQKLYLTTTCLQTGELVVFTNDITAKNGRYYKVKLIKDPMHFRRAVLASACMPVFMPPVQVNRDLVGDPDRNLQYVDGGVREYAGVNMAIDNGATHIFTILLSPEGGDFTQNTYGNLFGILERTIDIFMVDVGKNDLLVPAIYNEALQYIDNVKKKMSTAGLSQDQIDNFFNMPGRDNPFTGKNPLKVFIIRPELPLGGGPGGLVFDPAEMKNMMSKGEIAASTFIAGLTPDDINLA